jgi:hypothetical protein
MVDGGLGPVGRFLYFSGGGENLPEFRHFLLKFTLCSP